MHYKRTLAAMVLLAVTTGATAAPTPYRAEYKARYKGLPISAEGIRELRQTAEGTYVLSSRANAFLASIREETEFEWQDGKVLPVEYQYHRKGIGRNRSAVLSFDWANMQVRNDVQSQPWMMDIHTGVQDKLSYQLSMREAFIHARDTGLPWPELEYSIADGGYIKQYRFRVIGEETIETPVGDIRTIKAARIRDDSDRQTFFWLAPAYDFLLIRFEQQEADGDGFTLLLKEAVFAGKVVEGL